MLLKLSELPSASLQRPSRVVYSPPFGKRRALLLSQNGDIHCFDFRVLFFLLQAPLEFSLKTAFDDFSRSRHEGTTAILRQRIMLKKCIILNSIRSHPAVSVRSFAWSWCQVRYASGGRKTLYEILEVSPTASPKEIKAAFYRFV